MADHDPFCFDPVDWCICDRLRAARTDEQDTKFAQLDHAEAVAAKLVEVICEDAAVMAWDLKALEATARERDAARAEAERLREERDGPVRAWHERGQREGRREVLADLRGKVQAYAPGEKRIARREILALIEEVDRG